MKIVRLPEIVGTERDVEGQGWRSRRLLLRGDRMGFSLHETLIDPKTEHRFWYKNHLEAVYCVGGAGSIEDLATGEVHPIEDGTVYALDAHDRHVVRAGPEGLRLVCVFNPPVTGRETHDEDGSYELVE